MNTSHFCPWCGHELPDTSECINNCPAMTRNKPSWMNIFWIFESYMGVVIFSMITYYVGTGIGGPLGGSIGLFIPSLIFALLAKWLL